MKLENLYKFNTPLAFFNADKGMNPKEFIVDNNGKPYKEIWVASRFCYGLNQLRHKDYQVRLIEDDFPDAQLKNGDELLFFEVVEIQENGRRRGDEYKSKTSAIEEAAILSKEDYVATIKDAIQNKINKYGDFPCSLIGYNNIHFPDIDVKNVEEIASRFIRRQKIPFDEIWLFIAGKAWTYSIAKIYPDIEQLYPFMRVQIAGPFPTMNVF